MLERMRWRLTLRYAGIFVLFFLAMAAVAGFSRELTNQQDTLLTQEAKDQEPARRRAQGGPGRGLR
jgi:uncharacterized iron-regulated membrane protein